jgi:hypothetical protein
MIGCCQVKTNSQVRERVRLLTSLLLALAPLRLVAAFAVGFIALHGFGVANAQTPPRQPPVVLRGQSPSISIGKLPTPPLTSILTTIERGFDIPSKALAQTAETVLSVFGVPNAYVLGNDVSGAFLVGGRFGTGVLHSTVGNPSPVRWRAISVGLGLGANYGRVVMLVYGLDKLDDLFGLYGSLEGNFHAILGANTSIVTRGAVTIVIISSGLGLRLSGDASGILIDQDN